MKKYDIAIIGGGAAGLSAAARAIQRGRHVVIVDMGHNLARKVAISGGGRCNFTNMAASYGRYFGANRDFVRGPLARITPPDILDWAASHNLKWNEKSAGRFFCETGAADIVHALIQDVNGAEFCMNTFVSNVVKIDGSFYISTNRGDTIISAQSVIIATGGTSFGTLGVSDIGYRIAKSFGHKIEPPRPALCAIDTDLFPSQWAGISMRVNIQASHHNITDDMLFTHFGLGGPAIYSITLAPNNADININLLPDIDAKQWLLQEKRTHGRKSLSSILSMRMPSQIARYFAGPTRNIADFRDSDLENIAIKISNIQIPSSQWRYHGMAAAEVTYGGVSTQEISSKTMESKLCPGLFFAGEVMDITGDLGGFNLHWAFASGRIAGENA